MSHEIPPRLTAALEGRYRIEGALGEGGMATVYLAEDLKHERQVAIKVLKPELAAVIGGERFVSEIKTTAQLQHPHILPLFDSGEAEGFLFYVMPYIEGESLRERLDRERQLSVDEAVGIAEAVASALHYAHERGIVHRDIKPANILLHAGQPVVADFGIALAVSAAGGGRLTETGMSVGTPYYMSPEQATADRDVTAKSDIYSLACVLYEMLAGDPPHSGSNAQAVLMRILTEEARPVTDVRKSVPPHVRDVVGKGLEKLPADRFEDAEEFSRALADPAFRHLQRGVPGSPTAARRGGSEPSSSPWKLVALAVVPALVIGAAAGGWWALSSSDPLQRGPVIRMAFDSASGIQQAGLTEISDDGTTLAYIKRGNRSEADDGILVVELDGSGQRVLSGTDDAIRMVFSPDGAEIAYGTPDGIYRIPVQGGPPILVLDRPLAFPTDWAPDGTFYFTGLEGLFRLPPDAEPEQIASSGILVTSQAQEIPGGRWLLYSVRDPGNQDAGEVRIMDLESLESRTLLEGGFGPLYSPTGHVVFIRNDQSVLAAAFDVQSGEIIGRPFTVLDSVALDPFGGSRPLALSQTGSLFYVQGPAVSTGPTTRFMRFSSGGDSEILPIPPAHINNPEISPSGEHLAFVRGTELVVHELRNGRETRLVFGFGGSVRWSDDGESIVYVRLGGEEQAESLLSTKIWRWREGPTTREVPVASEGVYIATDWTPDGRLIGQETPDANFDNESDIVITDLDGTTTPYLEARWVEREPQVSPDGEWVAYTSDESGELEVYVRAYPTPGDRYDISAGPGSWPRWAPDGDLYFVRGDSLWLAELDLDPEPTVRSRRPVLAADQPEGHIILSTLTVAPDGDMIVLFSTSEEDDEDEDSEEQPRVAWIVANWFTELLEREGGR